MAHLMRFGQNTLNHTAHLVDVLTGVVLIYFYIAFLLTCSVTRIDRHRPQEPAA